MSISTANGFVTNGSTFADLIMDSASDTTWYKIWDSGTGEYVTDGALKVADGWVSAASLAQMTVDLSSGENQYYIKSYGPTSGQSAWTDMTISLATSDSYVSFADTTREAYLPIFYSQIIDTSHLTDNAWIRIWNAATDSYVGDGWVRGSDLDRYSFVPLEDDAQTEIWVDTYLYGSGRSGWENFTITHPEHTSSDAGEDGDEHGGVHYGSGDDQITGSDDADLIYAGSGNDIVDGGDGDDTLYGESGNDQLTGGEGINLLFGGSGTDTAVYEGDLTDYTFDWDGANLHVSTLSSEDTLDHVEQIKIGDNTYQVDDFIPLDINTPDPTVSTSSYEGSVSSAGDDSDSDPDLSDYTFLSGLIPGAEYILEGHRLETDLDPAMYVYSGLHTETDLVATGDATESGSLNTNGPNYLGYSDDAISVSAGPYGDPRLTITAPASGELTVIITNYASGSNTGGDGRFDYRLDIENTNTLTGTDAGETLEGDGGIDVIVGNGGNDTLTGNGGNDTFVFAPGDGEDTVTDFDANNDEIYLYGFDAIKTFAEVQGIMTQNGQDTVLSLGETDTITLQGVAAESLQADNFLFSYS